MLVVKWNVKSGSASVRVFRGKDNIHNVVTKQIKHSYQIIFKLLTVNIEPVICISLTHSLTTQKTHLKTLNYLLANT